MDNLVGHVDGFEAGDLRGWIVNLDDPRRLERVTCRGGNGSEVSFVPLIYRNDVAATMNLPGVFGFQVSWGLLRGLGRTCSIIDRYGRTLANGTSINIPEQPAADLNLNAATLFLHISKTAGTSLRTSLLDSVSVSRKLLIYPHPTLGVRDVDFLKVPLAQRDDMDWIFGHYKFGLDRFLTRASRYVTFVRAPMDRLRSNFAHHAAAGTAFEINGLNLRPSTVINEGLSEEFDNVMTRVITGLGADQVPLGQMKSDEVDIAINNVRRYFMFIGQTERAADDANLIRQALNLPGTNLVRENTTSNNIQYDDVEMNDVNWKQIEDRNSIDILLYERLRREGLLSNIILV